MKSVVVLVVSILAAIGLLSLTFFFFNPEEEVELPIVVEEYFDFNCPHCRDFHNTALQIKEDFGDDVDYRPILHPILGASSEQAAFAAEAAGNQGKFDEYTLLLFDNYESRTDEDYVAFAEELELDVEQFNSDRESDELQQRVLERRDENSDKGINSTPTVFVNDRRAVSLDYQELSENIQEKIELAKEQSVDSE